MLAFVLVGLYALSFFSTFVTRYLFAWLYTPEQLGPMLLNQQLVIIIRIFLKSAVSLGVAFWLYRDAKRTGKQAIIWLLVGLAFSVLGAVFYLLLEWRDREEGAPNQRLQLTGDARG